MTIAEARALKKGALLRDSAGRIYTFVGLVGSIKRPHVVCTDGSFMINTRPSALEKS